MLDTVFAQKKGMRQAWTADGKRVVVTELFMGGNTVVRTVSPTTVASEDGSQEAKSGRVLVGFADKKLKNLAKAQRTWFEKANLTVGKQKYQEVIATEPFEAGRIFRVEEIFQPGDVVRLTGTTKGRGFAGVVKRHGFSGGPRTHGQSDRERHPGSIGNRTTPGRVFKGKRMAGRYGQDTLTFEHVMIVAINEESQTVWVKGTVPGSFNGFLSLSKQEASHLKPVTLNEASKALLHLPVAKPAVEEVSAPETEETVTVEATQPEVVETAPEVAAPEVVETPAETTEAAE